MDLSGILNTGEDLFDETGSKVGTITDVVFEPSTLAPEWYDVKVGILGGHRLVPAGCVTVDAGQGASHHGTVPFDKKVVRTAPGAHIPPLDEETRSLLNHYRAA
jgi:hypothetical protein